MNKPRLADALSALEAAHDALYEALDDKEYEITEASVKVLDALNTLWGRKALIAAAPDMLAALETLLDTALKFPSELCKDHYSVIDSIAAIKKARGES
mgnify:FL=1